jgi:hypothetical protein
MLLADWKNNRLEKSVIQIYTKNSHQTWLVKNGYIPKLVNTPKKNSLWVLRYERKQLILESP